MAFVFWIVLIAGALALTPLLVEITRNAIKLAGYERRAVAAEARGAMMRARGRVVIDGDVHCPHGNFFPNQGKVECCACKEEGIDNLVGMEIKE